MLRLIQLITYMSNELEYTPEEIEAIFQAIENGKNTYLELIDALNLESGAGAMDQLACEKISSGKWRSAFKVCFDGYLV